MTISTTGFGLKPINKQGSNYTAAQVSEYKSFNPEYNLAFQMPVHTNYNAGGPRVAPQYTTSDRLTGSFVGCQYVSKSTGKPVFADHLDSTDLPNGSDQGPGNYFKLFSCFVTDDPYQLYSIKIDGDLTLSTMSGNCDLDRTGDSNTGATPAVSSDNRRSLVKLDSSTKSATDSGLRVKIMHIGTEEGDVSVKTSGYGYDRVNDVLVANSNIVVMLNNSAYNAGTERR